MEVGDDVRKAYYCLKCMKESQVPRSRPEGMKAQCPHCFHFELVWGTWGDLMRELARIGREGLSETTGKGVERALRVGRN